MGVFQRTPLFILLVSFDKKKFIIIIIMANNWYESYLKVKEAFDKRYTVGRRNSMSRLYDLWSRDLSADNPYLQQMANATNEDHMEELRSSAINWEAEQKRLAEQRSYESDSSAVARQRAAGLNPDLLLGSSASSGAAGASSSPIPVGEVVKDSTDISSQRQATQQNWVNTVNSTATSVMSLVQSMTGVIDGFSTLSASITAKRAQADIINQTKQSVISKVNAEARAAQVAAYSAEEKQLFDFVVQNYDALQGIEDFNIVDGVTYDPSDDIAAFLQDRGMPYDPATVDRIRSMYLLPDVKTKASEYRDAMREQLQLETWRVATDFYDRFAKSSVETQLYSAEFDASAAAFANTLQQMVYGTPDDLNQSTLNAISGTQSNEIAASYTSSQLKYEEAERSLNVFKERIGNLADMLAQIDVDIEHYNKQPQTVDVVRQLQMLHVRRMMLCGTANNALGNIYSIFSGYLTRSAEATPILMEGHVNIGEQSVWKHKREWYQYLFGDDVGSAQSKKNEITSFLFELLKDIALFVK